MSGIHWLVSYPKSGNTWMRVFLANLTGEGSGPVSINELETGGIASARGLFDDLTGVEASELREEEIERLRPRVYGKFSSELKAEGDCRFVKVHDAWTLLDDGAPLFPSVGRVLYIIRNPLDVAVSYAHFRACPMDEIIRQMGDREAALCQKPDRLHLQLRQRLLSWSGHVRSWVDRSGMPLEVIRFEDMKSAPLETFERAVRFLGLDASRERILRALEYSSFDELRGQEEAAAFRERGRGKVFFRRGEVGAWRDELTPDQVRRILSDHQAVMARFGYLPSDWSTES
ncbi:MAG: sulfotransferase domain-containing protein [Acidobacteriota bacterium]